LELFLEPEKQWERKGWQYYGIMSYEVRNMSVLILSLELYFVLVMRGIATAFMTFIL
jgi:hypothetical protein